MKIIKPKSLQEGDNLAIIAPAGVVSKEKIDRAVAYFERKNYRVTLGKNLFKSYRDMAGSDYERLEDLHRAFSDKNIDAIISARGGYGSIRLLKSINYDIIKNNPKIFCGFSDITALSLMFLKNSGLITYSAPMAQSDFSDISEFTEKSFFSAVTGSNQQYKSDKIYKSGTSQGIIWGGNLSTIVSLCGLDFLPDEDFIFFAEDVAEPAYKIDKMLTQLTNMDKFRNYCKGIAFGKFTNSDNSDWIDEICQETAGLLDIPTFGGFEFSHNKDKQTIPVGCRAAMDNGIINLEF